VISFWFRVANSRQEISAPRQGSSTSLCNPIHHHLKKHQGILEEEGPGIYVVDEKSVRRFTCHAPAHSSSTRGPIGNVRLHASLLKTYINMLPSKTPLQQHEIKQDQSEPERTVVILAPENIQISVLQRRHRVSVSPLSRERRQRLPHNCRRVEAGQFEAAGPTSAADIQFRSMACKGHGILRRRSRVAVPVRDRCPCIHLCFGPGE